MDYVQYVGIAVVCFLGLLAGVVLGAVAREEVTVGRRWLLLLKKGIYALLVASLLYYHHTLLQTAMILVFGGVGYLALNYRAIYSLLGLALGLAYLSPAFLPVAALAFLFGLPTGSLMASTRKHARLPRMLLSTARQMWWIFFPPAVAVPVLPFLLAYL